MNIFEMLRCQAVGQGGVVELRIMARTGHRADVHEAFDAIGLQQGDEALDWQSRMAECEHSAFRPMRCLRARMFAHDDGPEHVGCRVNSIGPYTISNKPNAAIQHAADRARRIIMSSGFHDAATRVIAAALMRTKIATVAQLAVRSRPVCPSVTRGITARIMVPMAPAVSAWIAEATGTPAPRIESPSSAVPTTIQA